MKPHKHAELIKAWADGAQIEHRRLESWGMSDWELVSDHLMVWHETDVHEYRIKPEPKPDVVMTRHVELIYAPNPDNKYRGSLNWDTIRRQNVRFIFDGETQELKSVELIK